MDEVRNQLKSQNLSTVSPTAFGDVGGRVFPDNPSIDDINALIQIVRGWRAVHLPSLGSPIARSATITNQTGNGSILGPVENEVFEVQSLGFSNVDVGPQSIIAQVVNNQTGAVCPININLDVATGNSTLILQAGETTSIPLSLILDSNHTLFLAVISGDPSACEMSAYHFLRSQ